MREPPDYDAIEKSMWRQHAESVIQDLENLESNFARKIRSLPKMGPEAFSITSDGK